MIPDPIKAKLLLSVANGKTLSEAGSTNGLKPEQARNAIFRICREARLSSGIADIHADPERYKAFALKVINDAKYGLRTALRSQLTKALKLRSPDELTPPYVSNLTAEMLLHNGISSSSVAEIQEWLLKNDATLKLREPLSQDGTKLVRRAVFLLSAFGFDVAELITRVNEFDQ